MKSRTLTCVTAMTLFAALSIRLAAQEKQDRHNHVRYTVSDLGTLGGTFSQAFGINNKGSVVGFATLNGDTALHAFVWRKGVMADLGTLAPTDTLPYSMASSINDNEEVVGFSETSTLDPLGENFCGDSLVCLPVLWRDGKITTLPTLRGTNGQALGINDQRQVVGFAETTTHDPACPPPQVLRFKPVIWERGKVHVFPTLRGLPNGIATAINQKGQAVGVSGSCSLTASHALLWDHGTITDLGTLGGLLLAPGDINNEGQVVGVAFQPGGANVTGFLWQNGKLTALGTLPGDAGSSASSINDKGQVIGQSTDANGNNRGFLWQDGVMTDLTTLVPPDSSLVFPDPLSINSRGEIVGLGVQISTGELRAFLLIPCDEDHGDSECEDEGEGTAAVRGETNQRPNVVLPENVRGILRQRLGSRYHSPGIVASPRE